MVELRSVTDNFWKSIKEANIPVRFYIRIRHPKKLKTKEIVRMYTPGRFYIRIGGRFLKFGQGAIFSDDRWLPDVNIH